MLITYPTFILGEVYSMLLIRLTWPTADFMTSRRSEASSVCTHLQTWAAFPDTCSFHSCSFWQPTMSNLSTFLTDWDFTWLINSLGSRNSTDWSRPYWTLQRLVHIMAYAIISVLKLLYGLSWTFCKQCCEVCQLINCGLSTHKHCVNDIQCCKVYLYL